MLRFSQGASPRSSRARRRTPRNRSSELESLKGQIRYFDLQVAQSDLQIHLRESGGVAAGALQRVTRAASASVEVFARSVAAVIYLVVYLIPWVILAALLWMVGRRLVGARRRGQ